MKVCFYPACMNDVDPIIFLKDECFNYIYADPEMKRERIINEFHLEGYVRNINELQEVGLFKNYNFDNWEYISRNLDENAYSHNSPYTTVSGLHIQFEKDNESLINVYYFFTEGIETYYNLFNVTTSKPQYLAIVHPGWGADFLFENEDGDFYSILHENNTGFPNYLLTDNRVEWLVYSNAIRQDVINNRELILYQSRGNLI